MEETFKNVWWVLLLPLFGFVWQALAGKIVISNLGPKIGRPVMGAFAVLPVLAAFGIAVDLTLKLSHLNPSERTVVLTLFDWIHVQSLWVPFEFRVDTLSMTMVLIITGIGSLIHLYAVGYMAEEVDFSRFFTYLNLFIAAMLTLVLGNNLVLLFVGWEGVGLCSYLLIGFWYKDTANSKAANKAFIVNRIGDYGLSLGLFLIVFLVTRNAQGGDSPRWLSYDVILPLLGKMGSNPAEVGFLTAVGLLLFVGAMGKSAQFPLYIWLPDAMAGPTPVSALIHAATMVTSGVFLLNRMHVVFEASPVASGVVALVGAITSLLGALIAFGQTDIKKVLAFSTVSQLGYMFIACGSGAMWAGMFHVTTHAFFKALLFLGSGAVIHAMAHNQDMRNYGKLLKYLPVTGVCMLAGWLAISGFPWMAGFFSKEEALGAAVNSDLMLWGLPAAKIAGWMGFGVAFLTAAYMTRMTMLTFFSGRERWRDLVPEHGHHSHHDHVHAHEAHEDPQGFFMDDKELAAYQVANVEPEHHELEPGHTPHEVPWTMFVPLIVLAIASVAGGLLLKNGNLFEFWLYPEHAGEPEKAEAVSHMTLFVVSMVAAFGGMGLGAFQYARSLPANEGFDLSKWNPVRIWAGKQFGIDHALADGGVELGSIVGNASASFDRGFVDGIVNGVSGFVSGVGGLVGRFQSGYIRGYALLMQVGALAVVAYFIYVIVQLRGSL